MESKPDEPEIDEDFTLIGGPCCGDVITPDKSDNFIRLGVVAGCCLDKIAPLHLKGKYTEALYNRRADNKWVYVGRYRWNGDKTYFSES